MKKKIIGFVLGLISLPLISKNTDKSFLKIVLTGDLMLGTNFPDKSYLHKKPYHLIEIAHPILKSADLSLGNLEGAMTDLLTEQKKCNNPEYCYLFNMPTTYASILSKVGFDGMSLANNHSGDFGDIGRERTIFFLKNAGIESYGTKQKEYAIVERKGLKIGLIDLPLLTKELWM